MGNGSGHLDGHHKPLFKAEFGGKYPDQAEKSGSGSGKGTLRHDIVLGAGGWVKGLTFCFPGGGELWLRGEKFHIFMGRRLGWGAIKSANFSIEINGREGEERSWEFSGKGLGHGVGLCQWGARALAGEGKRCIEILAEYFPGVKVGYCR